MERLRGQMRINLRCLDIRMSQQLGYDIKRDVPLNQMRGKGMTDRMKAESIGKTGLGLIQAEFTCLRLHVKMH